MAFFIYILVYLQIEANLISPKVQSKGMRLPALLVLASVTIGVYMFGLIGAIVAIPVAGCIKVLIEEYGSGRDEAEKPKEVATTAAK
jgi:predicted PurR-regulated permease PerM